jgi:hypothetical protein
VQECTHLISIGVEDGCIMQWKYTRDDKAAQQHTRYCTTAILTVTFTNTVVLDFHELIDAMSERSVLVS